MRSEVRLKLACHEGFLWVLFLSWKVHELSSLALEAGSGSNVPTMADQLCLLPPVQEGRLGSLPLRRDPDVILSEPVGNAKLRVSPGDTPLSPGLLTVWKWLSQR